MKRATVRIDVAAIGRNEHCNYVCANRAKQFRAQLEGRSVRAVENNSKASQVRARNQFFAQEFQVFRIEGFIGSEARRAVWRRVAAMLENVGFQPFLDGVGKFHARVRKKLYAIVLKRIVRG